MKLPPLLRLMRPFQWYKNVLVFLALIFVGDLFNPALLTQTLLGFIALCMTSSSYYIINDLVDRESDRKHPEKKFRPLASKAVSVPVAILLSALLLLGGIFISLSLSFPFFVSILILFAGAQVYSFILKNQPIMDVITIGIFFVIRAVSGPLILDITISPWLIICTFFMALFLALLKRRGDLLAGSKRKVFKLYTEKLLDNLTLLSLTLLMVSYTFYSFLTKHATLIMTIPLALYGLIRYYALAIKNPKLARHPHAMINDKFIVGAIALWAILVVLILYDIITLPILR